MPRVCESELARVLRRWAKAARTRVKKELRSAFMGGSDKTSRRSTAESTLGAGMKQFAGTIWTMDGEE